MGLCVKTPSLFPSVLSFLTQMRKNAKMLFIESQHSKMNVCLLFSIATLSPQSALQVIQLSSPETPPEMTVFEVKTLQK